MLVGNGGFEIFSDPGFKLGGTDFVNLVFYAKSTLTTTRHAITGPGFDPIPNSGIGSAVVPDDGGVLRFYRSISGAHFLEQDGKIFSETIGAVFECYSFGPAFVSGGTNGWEFFREADGVCTFSATKPFLRLAGVFIDPTPVSVPDETGVYPYSVDTLFSEGARKFAYQFSNAHYHYRLVRPFGRPYNVSYNSVRMARMQSNGRFDCRYVSKYMWTHSWAHARVREVPNKSAPQRMLIADVTGL